jgi:hypothetical protein
MASFWYYLCELRQLLSNNRGCTVAAAVVSCSALLVVGQYVLE